MITHAKLGDNFAGRRELSRLIIYGQITIGGNIPGKIYGLLSCRSGKRMKTANRIFFINEQEALAAGYRPCVNCMPRKYKLWKAQK